MNGTSIRPALEMLRELDSGNLLDKVALAIHNASNTTRELSKPSKVVITIDIKLLTAQHLSEPAITMSADVDTKMPKPKKRETIFWFGENDEVTTTQRRQKDLGLTVAPANINEGDRAHG